ncbi:uncharacterized protein L201_001599 [Kwoniella dendrophila CBS 6074]|uniref:Carboxylic ester hydrolase n=1 Tax=Kwoniella dendrophila CBS 6074 TaxID=1295534 RepID=A0AAX4JNS1_9TREE
MKWTILLSLLPLVVQSAPVNETASSASSAIQSSTPIAANATASATATATAGSSASTVSGSTSGNNSTSTSNNPSVTIYPDTSNGNPVEITGLNFAAFQQDVYLGVPYAKPPVGDLRFAPPESYTYNFSVTAQKPPPACLQDPTGSGVTSQSEDCLYLNVYAPQGANAQTTWLPVMVWIYGGSFTSGNINIYNATALEAFAAKTGKPFIFVALNYRLGAFGWPTGSGFAENNAANLGLKDIKKGLEWVQENIWAFGGNPDQVTVFGESAGAIAISLLYLDENINTFKGAIMESGAQSTTPIGPTASTFEDAYQALLVATNCSGSASASTSPATAGSPSTSNSTTPATSAGNSTSSSANSTVAIVAATSANSTGLTGFECLKALPAEALLKGQLAVKSNLLFSGFVYGPTVDGDLIPDSPHTLLSQGKFAKIPFISGNNKDEGTAFIPSFVNSTAIALQLVDILEPVDPSNSTLAELFTVYPSDPSLGSPFDTGNQTFGFAPAHKQVAAIVGDGQFQAPRRYFLQQAESNGLDQVWTYQFEQLTPGANPALGVYHGSEVPYVYGAPAAAAVTGSSSVNYTAADQEISLTMMNYWLNFAYYTNPNAPSGSDALNSTNWPTYTNDKNILRLKGGNTTVFKDDYRQQGTDFFLNNAQQFNYKRDFIPIPQI